eukprot:scaffold65929_cov34-Tisochrysis_lutea.AAC.4
MGQPAPALQHSYSASLAARQTRACRGHPGPVRLAWERQERSEAEPQLFHLHLPQPPQPSFPLTPLSSRIPFTLVIYVLYREYAFDSGVREL